MDQRALQPSYAGPRRADPQDWEDSRDIEREPGQGYAPRYFRCINPRCFALVTDGQVLLGGCICGGGKMIPAGTLSDDERIALLRGDYPLTQREYDLILPLKDCRVTSIVEEVSWQDANEC